MSPWHDSAVSSCGKAPHVAPFCFCVQETLHRRAGIPLFWEGGWLLSLSRCSALWSLGRRTNAVSLL